METVRVHVPPVPAAPPSADFIGTLAAALFAAAASLRRGLRRAVTALAGPNPQDEVRSAQDMLALARSVERHSPGLAAELRAIATHWPSAAQHGG